MGKLEAARCPTTSFGREPDHGCHRKGVTAVYVIDQISRFFDLRKLVPAGD